VADSIVFAGVDEAGLGPILGPLALGFSAFRAPRKAADPWRALAPIVSDDPRRDAGSFVVADSKRVFQRTARCARRLEATALGFLALLDAGRRPHTNVARFLWETPAELAVASNVVARHPWYRDGARRLPRHWDAESLELRVESLHRALRRAGIELLDAGVRVVPEAELNRSFDETSNKSLSHWHASRPIFRRLWERCATEELELVVDRHGGRMHYGSMLARDFQDASVLLVEEAPERSTYALKERRGPRSMRITFAERAEQASFAVALASCLAKYARESAMASLNEWFGARQAGLDPTAGYTTDGRRWLGDAHELIEREKIDRGVLVRTR
jgi:ribonuclease HII